MSTNPSHDDSPMDDAAATSAQPPSEPTGVGERTALLQLERATGMLHERAPDAPVDFVIRLFAGAAAEDLLRYQPQELAELAAASWHFLAERAPRTAKIRVSNPDGGPRLDNISVIELVNDDMPFLVNSVMGELNHRGLETYLLVHPVFRVARDAAGKLIRFGNGIEAAPLRESIIQVHVDRIDDDAARSALAEALAGVVSDVRLAVQDWRSMLDRVGGIIDALKTDPPPLPEDDVTETIAFLEWLKDNNFTFLGVREYRLEADGAALAAIPSSTLGVLRGNQGEPGTVGSGRIEMSPPAKAAFEERRLMLITNTSARSRVHRRVPMDMIGIKHFRDGRPSGGVQIVGLFTSTAYTRSTRNIPYLRRKVAGVLARAGFTPDSHSGKTLANVLDTYPRDELFQIDEDTLVHFALIILQLNERPRVRVLTRFDFYERFASVLVYVPREPYGSSARAMIGRVLAQAFNGEIASFVPYFPEGPLVRVHFIIARRDVPLAHPERAQLEAEVARIMKTWPDFLLEALLAAHDPPAARDLFARYSEAFSPTYRDAFSAASAVEDIATIEQMSTDAPLGVDFQRPAGGDGAARLKLWSHGRPLPLSERVPVLEHMGFTVVDESTYHAEPCGRGAPSSSGSTTCCSPSPATARSTSARCARSSTTASPPSCAPMRRTTATTRSCCASASHGARWRWCARCRAICARSACPIRRTTCGRRWCATPSSRRSSSRCSRRGSIRTLGSMRRSARSVRPTAVPPSRRGSRRSRASTRTASCATSSTP